MTPPSYLCLLVALNISVYPGDIQVVRRYVTSVTQDVFCRGSIPAGMTGSPRFLPQPLRLGGRAHVKTLNILVCAAAAASAALLGAGAASALPSAGDVVGKTYTDVSKLIQQGGGTPIVAT